MTNVITNEHAITRAADLIHVGDVFVRPEAPTEGWEVVEQIALDLFELRRGGDRRLERGRWLNDRDLWIRRRAV